MPRALFFVVTFCLATSILRPISDPDLWWHIVVGRWTIANQQVPMKDIWNSFSMNSPWQAYSWLFEVLAAYAEKWGGMQALFVCYCVTTILLGASLLYCFKQLSRNDSLSVILSCACLIGLERHLELRPQTYTWILVAFFIAALDRTKSELQPKLAQRRITLISICLGCAWANIHLSLIIPLLIAVVWLWDSANKSLVFVTAAAFMLGSLVNPYGVGVWKTLVQKGSHPFQHLYITEFQPLTLHYAGAGISVLLLVVLLLLNFGQTNRSSNLRLLAAVGFFGTAWAIQKFLPFALIFLAASVAVCWRERYYGATEDQIRQQPFVLAIAKLSRRMESIPLGLSVVLMLVLTAVSANNISSLLKQPVNERTLPLQAVAAIKQQGFSAPVLTGFNEGGFLLYSFADINGVPKFPVALDGRTNINRTDVVTAFLKSLRGQTGWEDYLQLVQPKTILWESQLPLTSILLAGDQWCLRFPESKAALRSERWAVFTPCA